MHLCISGGFIKVLAAKASNNEVTETSEGDRKSQYKSIIVPTCGRFLTMYRPYLSINSIYSSASFIFQSSLKPDDLSIIYVITGKFISLREDMK